MPIRLRHILVYASCCVVSAAASRGEESPTPAVPVERLIAQLAAPDFATREDAAAALMEHEGMDDATLTAAFRTADAPEQRHRLTRIALHCFYRQVDPLPAQPGEIEAAPEQAALGVDLSGGPAQVVRPYQNELLTNPAILVTKGLPGFPAYAHLRGGDLIVAINDAPFTDDLDVQQFTQKVQEKQAGETISLKVLRGERYVEVTFVLDSMRRLAALYAGGPRDEEWAMSRPDFHVYLNGLMGASTVPIIEIRVRSPQNAGGAATPNRDGSK